MLLSPRTLLHLSLVLLSAQAALALLLNQPDESVESSLEFAIPANVKMSYADSGDSNVTIDSPHYWPPSSNETNLQEIQPSNFVISIRYKPRGVALYNIDVLALCVRATANVALRDFNEPAQKFWHNENGMTLRFSSTKAQGQPGYQAKTIMWATRLMLIYFRSNEHVSELTFTAFYQDLPAIGFGQLLIDPGSVESALNDTSVVRSNSEFSADDLIETTDFVYQEDGPRYKPVELYLILISLLIGEAQRRLFDSCRRVWTPNEQADVTLLIEATSDARMRYLTHFVIIRAAAHLAHEMPRTDARHRWRQFTFLIRNDGVIVGRGALTAGVDLEKQASLEPQLIA